MSSLPVIATRHRARAIASVVALSLGQAAAAGTAAFATRDIFSGLYTAGDAVPRISLCAIALAGLVIAACRAREAVIAEGVGQDYAADLREKLFAHLSRLPVRTLARRRSGGLTLRFVGDLAAVRGWISLGIARLISAAIVLPAALAVIWALDPALGSVAALPTVVGLSLMAIIGWRFEEAHRRLRSRRAALAAEMGERIPKAPELRLLGRMPTERRNLRRRTASLLHAALHRTTGSALMRAVPDVVSGVAAAGILLVASLGHVGPAEAAGALATVALMIKPMRDLAGVWNRWRSWVAVRDRCRRLLEQRRVERKASRRSAGRTKPRQGAPLALSFVGVRTELLKRLTAEAPSGRRLAILGHNGSGKSSLLSLAAGLEAPGCGRILIGGQRTNRLSDAARARMIAYCSEGSPILAGTLRRALTPGARARPSDKDIEVVAHSLGLADVLRRLGGLGGRIAEGGRNLSAGEVRRVLLARALLSGAGLMLLDELDDALDADAPSLMARLLDRTNATVVFVTHNPAVARLADEAWVLEGGRIADRGTPGDVLARRLSQTVAA